MPVCCHSAAAMDAANLLRRSICTHSFFSDALSRCCFFRPRESSRERALAPPESECSSTRRLQAKGLNNSLWPEEKKALPGSVCCRRFNDLGYTRGVTSRGQSVQTTLRERERADDPARSFARSPLCCSAQTCLSR